MAEADEILQEINAMAGIGVAPVLEAADAPVPEKDELADHMAPDPPFKAQEEEPVVAEEEVSIPEPKEVPKAETKEEPPVEKVVEAEDGPVTVPDALRELLEQHAQELMSVRQGQPSVQPVAPVPAPAGGAATPQATEPVVPVQPPVPSRLPEFVTEQLVAEIAEDPRKLNAVLQNVYQQAVHAAMFQVMPIVQDITSQQIRNERAINNFMQNNKDLVPIQGYVAKTCMELQQQHPDWGIEKVLSEAGPEVRRQVRKFQSVMASNGNVPAAQVPAGKGRTPNPAFAGRPAARTARQESNGETSVIDEIMAMKNLRG